MKNHIRRNLAKVSSIVLASFMFANLLGGCSSDKVTSESTTTTVESVASSESTKSAEVKPDTSPLTLTAFYYQPKPYDTNWGSDKVSKAITERTGITLDVKFSATGDGQDLSIMLASGEALPDIIVNDAGNAMANTMKTQGFVQDLNKLAKQYSPDFFKYLPENFQSVWGEKDESLYCVVDFYGDNKTLSGFKSTGAFGQSIQLQKAALEKIGNPSITTLDELKAAMLKVKEQCPDIKYILTPGELNPWGGKSWSNILTRIYGGGNPISIQADGSVHYYYKDDPYKKAMAYLNDLYRAGLINPEVLTWNNSNDIRDEARKSLKVFANMGSYQDFVTKIDKGFTADSPYKTIEYPKVTGVDGIKIKNDYVMRGGWHGIFISKDTKHADRAIQYITYMISDEGQLLQRFGIEGEDFVMAEDGSPKATETAAKLQRDNYDEFTKTTGANNWNWAWFESMRTVAWGNHWDLATKPPLYEDQMISQKYSSDELLNDLVGTINDEEIRIINSKIEDLWEQSQNQMILAKTPDAFETAYKTFVDKAEKLGAPTLEKYFADNYKKWTEQGMK